MSNDQFHQFMSYVRSIAEPATTYTGKPLENNNAVVRTSTSPAQTSNVTLEDEEQNNVQFSTEHVPLTAILGKVAQRASSSSSPSLHDHELTIGEIDQEKEESTKALLNNATETLDYTTDSTVRDQANTPTTMHLDGSSERLEELADDGMEFESAVQDSNRFGEMPLASLNEDTFSFVVSAPVCSVPFVTGIFIFVVKTSCTR